MGEYQYALDTKGRISLPQKLRKNIDMPGDQVFVVTRGMDHCLLLYPQLVWNQIAEKIEALNFIGSSDHRAFIRIFLSWANEIELDRQFRLNIPQRHRDFAGIEKDAVILGLLDKIELWSPERFENYQETTQSDYEGVAGKIMGL